MHTQNTERSPRTYGQILKSSILVGGSSAANIVIGIARAKAMAVLLGPAGVGLAGLYNSISELAAAIAGLGVNSSGVRQIAAAVGSGDTQLVARTTVVLRRVSLLLGLLGAGVLIAFSGRISLLTFGNTKYIPGICLLAIGVFFRLVSAGQAALIQGLRRISDLAKMGVWGACFGAVCTVLIVFFLRENGIALSLVCGAAISILVSWLYSRKVRIAASPIAVSEVAQDVAGLLKLGIAFMVTGLLTMGSAYVIRIIILRQVGFEGAGLFQSAWTIGGLYVGFILQAMGADFYPRLTARANDHTACNQLVNEQAYIGLLLGGPGVLATLSLAPFVIAVFYTAKFHAAVQILRWLCLGTMLQVISWPMGFIVLAKGRQNIFLASDLAWTAVYIGLAWMCVKRFGLTGVGIAFFVSYVFHLAMTYPIVKHLSGFAWSSENKKSGLLFLIVIAAVFCGQYMLPAGWAITLGLGAFALSAAYSIRILVGFIPLERIPRPFRLLLLPFGCNTPRLAAIDRHGMQNPTVSFIVPCYNLAHLLRECIESILSQTYGDFEILILDDCSPDDTPSIATSFPDSRVTHVRNTENLGHLRNYNKGIAMSQGKYIWLISADDRLRTPHILERYVRVMDANPNVGFCCCPAMKLQGGVETDSEGVIAIQDTVFDGRKLLRTLFKGNCIIAASGMVRKSCYEQCGTFPLDLPYAGDWLLWCFFALQHQVAYFAEPMVNYRAHELSMTNHLMSHKAPSILREGFAVLWRVRNRARQLAIDHAAHLCEANLAALYAQHLIGGKQAGHTFRMTAAEFESSLMEQCITQAEKERMEARVWSAVADKSVRLNDFGTATACYKRALRHDRSMLKAWLKLLLLTAGAGRGFSAARGLWRLRKIAVR